MKRIAFLLLAFMLICSMSISAFAAGENQFEETFVAQVEVVETSVNRNNSSEPIYSPGKQTRGTSKPTSDWDLSNYDYTIQFDMSVAIFTNVNFKNHGGEFYVNIDCSSDKDQTMYAQLYEKGKNDVATEAIIDTNGSWNIRYYNLDTTKSYYIRFVKIDDGISVYGNGTAYIN